jgi:putative MFS transporter
MLKGSTMTSSILASMAMQAFGLVGIAIVWLLVDKVGRKWIQSIGFLALGIVFIISGLVRHPAFGLFLMLFLILSVVDQGPGQLTYVYAGEVFPTSIRASGHGFATAMSRVGALLGISVVPFFIAHVGLSTALIVFGICDLLGFALTWWLAPETKGKALPTD